MVRAERYEQALPSGCCQFPDYVAACQNPVLAMPCKFLSLPVSLVQPTPEL